MKNMNTVSVLDRTKMLLVDYGIPSHLTGFSFLAEAVVLKLSLRYKTVKEIYSAIASRHNKSVGSVARDLNYAIKQSEILRNRLYLKEDEVIGGRIISSLAILFKPDLLNTDLTNEKAHT